MATPYIPVFIKSFSKYYVTSYYHCLLLKFINIITLKKLYYGNKYIIYLYM